MKYIQCQRYFRSSCLYNGFCVTQQNCIYASKSAIMGKYCVPLQPRKLVQELTCIREMLVSNLDRNIDYHEVLRGLLWSLHGNSRMVY
jgi:hypothetical protein